MKQLMSIKEVLDYLEKAPTKFYVSSFSGGAVHVKFLIPEVGALRRNTTWKLAINGINRDANFGNQSVDDKRLNLFNLHLHPIL